MDKLVEVGQWWLLLIPLGTGVCALLGSWLGASLSRYAERKQWTRNRKQEAYALFIGRAGFTANDVILMLDRSKFSELLTREVERMQAYWQLEVVASNTVSNEANRLINGMKAYRRILGELESARTQGAKRLENPLEADSEDILEMLKDLLDQYENKKHLDLVFALTDSIYSITFDLIASMRKDLGLPMAIASHTKDNDQFEEFLTSMRRMWLAYGIDSTKDEIVTTEDGNVVSAEGNETRVQAANH